jgi:RNA polymerase sigma factor (TIGR02999 family)
MRRILVERARQKGAVKRGRGSRPISLDDIDIAAESQSDILLALDDVLARYAQKDAVGAELIKLRFFAGLPNDQAAAILNIPERTAKRTWAYARAWLYRELQKSMQK